MRVLISGAAGFIGSHLADLLLSQGHDVVGVDNFITGRRRNIAHLDGDRRFTLFDHDVTRPLAIDGPVDRIYHLASPASPAAYEKHRIATMQVNSQGTWNLLDLSLEKGSRFLLTSTSEIYGDPTGSSQREDYWGNVNPIGLRSMYEEAKRFGEACVMAYHRERQADTRIVRLFSTYGPRMQPADGRVVTNFIRQAIGSQPITVTGDGTQTRSFCYVSDTVRGIQLAMECDFHEPINVGNPEESSILQLARDIVALVPGSTSRIVFQAGGEYDPRTRCPDLLRARQLLGWTPQVSRQDGLAKTVQHMTEHEDLKTG